MSIESVILSNHLILCHTLLLLPSISPRIRSFPMSQLFMSGGHSIGASASVPVLPMNIQGWFPLEWTGLISLQAKGLSRVFSNTTIQKHQFMLDLSSLTRDQAFALYSGSLEPQPLNYQGRSLIILLKKKKRILFFFHAYNIFCLCEVVVFFCK